MKSRIDDDLPMRYWAPPMRVPTSDRTSYNEGPYVTGWSLMFAAGDVKVIMSVWEGLNTESSIEFPPIRRRRGFLALACMFAK